MKDRENKKVEVRTKSGEKFATEHGFNAIKDGIKQSRAIEADIDRKPPWLRVKLGAGPKYKEVKNLVTKHRLSTVCEESHCPNIGECWNHGRLLSCSWAPHAREPADFAQLIPAIQMAG